MNWMEVIAWLIPAAGFMTWLLDKYHLIPYNTNER